MSAATAAELHGRAVAESARGRYAAAQRLLGAALRRDPDSARRAEILVVAAGHPGLIRAEMVNRSAVVIDCGINTTADGIVGDVDFAAVRPVVSAITPVPGGVGPVTTMTLLEQTMQAFERLSPIGEPSLDRFRVDSATGQGR